MEIQPPLYRPPASQELELFLFFHRCLTDNLGPVRHRVVLCQKFVYACEPLYGVCLVVIKANITGNKATIKK